MKKIIDAELPAIKHKFCIIQHKYIFIKQLQFSDLKFLSTAVKISLYYAKLEFQVH